MSDHTIRDANEADFGQILALNDNEVQWTSPMSDERLAHLAELASYHKVLLVDGKVAGFLIAIGNDRSYTNANYEWFSARYPSFLYVDRVVVSHEHAGAGLGSFFYSDVIAYAQSSSFERVVCEYNVQPLNEPSQAFHNKFGFVEVGRQVTESPGKEVSMQSKDL